MTITKQELTKLIAQISKLAKKDSDFPQASSLTSSTDFTVLQGGTNKRVGANAVKGYILDSNVLNEIIGKFEGRTENATLQAMLNELLHRITVIENNGSSGHNPSNISASGVSYEGSEYYNVQLALDYIMGILRGYTPFPGIATKTDIMNILNQ